MNIEVSRLFEEIGQLHIQLVLLTEAYNKSQVELEALKKSKSEIKPE